MVKLIQVLPLVQDQLTRRWKSGADEAPGDIPRPLPAGGDILHGSAFLDVQLD